ncbi:MAG: peptide-methionine (S)-S-oxide reductase MsrA [Thermoleophilia bacterium]|nr:peptide-methionine (S)-S-oxide reductase MsrA [Thermoleophilia bacterium]
MEKAIFAAGCFWHVEDAFRGVKGVESAVSGYTGGHTDNPSYSEVCTGKTGHAESVLVEFDPAAVSYEDLLAVFWSMHDPTTRDRQGPDVGSQYRSAIFYLNEEQKAAAEKSREQLDSSGGLRGPIVTEISPAGTFYPAEEYHQRYYEKHGIRHC